MRSADQGGRRDAGFAMVEMLAAIFVFGILAVAVLGSLTQSLDVTRSNQSRVVAANLAARQIEVARNLDVKQIPNGLSSYTQTVDGQTYTVTQTANYVPLNSTQSTCQSASGTRLAYKRVTVEVTWPRMNGVKPVRSDTVKTLESTSLDPLRGSVSALVLGRNGTPHAGIPVTINPGAVTQTTGDDGCAIFPELSTGSTYALSLSNGLGWIDPFGNPTPSIANIPVNASQNTPRSFEYDRASTLSVTFAAPAGYTVFPTVGNTGSGTFGLTVRDANPSREVVTTRRLVDCAASAVAGCLTGPRVVTNVYPSQQGYRAWAGTCADVITNDSTPPPATLTPGTTSALTVNTGGIPVIAGSLAAPTLNRPLYAVHLADAGSCTGGEVYRLGTSGATPVMAALPYGTWRISQSTNTSGPATIVTLSAAQPTGGYSAAAPAVAP